MNILNLWIQIFLDSNSCSSLVYRTYRILIFIFLKFLGIFQTCYRIMALFWQLTVLSRFLVYMYFLYLAGHKGYYQVEKLCGEAKLRNINYFSSKPQILGLGRLDLGLGLEPRGPLGKKFFSIVLFRVFVLPYNNLYMQTKNLERTINCNQVFILH